MCASENIVALCDVDSDSLAFWKDKLPAAKTYKDYREMLDKEKSLDAVSVTIPDHQHGPAAMMAMALGKHVYCEKPLTHSVWETRQLMLAARKYGVVTQMGNQGHCGDGNRRLCELIAAGAIGAVREVHCWTGRQVRIRCRRIWIGICGLARRQRGLLWRAGRKTRACRSIALMCGAAGGILAAGPSETWRATSWTARFGR
jgi:hypothetical protein